MQCRRRALREGAQQKGYWQEGLNELPRFAGFLADASGACADELVDAAAGAFRDADN